MRLYEISDELRAVLAELDEAEGVLEGDLEERLDAVQMAFADKVQSCLALAAERAAEAGVMASEAERMRARSKAASADADRLRAYVHRCMNAAGERKVVTTLFTARIAKNPAKLVVFGDVPEAWTETITTIKPRNADIKAALTRGEALPFARLEQGETLRVK